MQKTLEGFVENVELSKYQGITDVTNPFQFTATLIDNLNERYSILSYPMPESVAKAESGKIAQRKVRVDVAIKDSLYHQNTPYQILNQ